MDMMRIAKIIGELYRRICASAELNRYTPFTIAEYLRRSGAQIGEGCYIAPTVLGTEPYLVKIGNHVAIEDGVSFMTHDGAARIFRNLVPDLQVLGPIVIGDNCFIGQRAILSPNIRIGPNSVVAPGSVVISDVPPGTLVMGVPARPFGSLEQYRGNCLQRWEQQRPRDIELAPGETWWTTRKFRANRERLRKHLSAIFRDQLAQNTSAASDPTSDLCPADKSAGES